MLKHLAFVAGLLAGTAATAILEPAPTAPARQTIRRGLGSVRGLAATTNNVTVCWME